MRTRYSRSTNENWMFFKQKFQKAIDMHVPHKITKAKLHLPWLFRTIKRHIRKRDKLPNKDRHSRENSDWSTYRKQRNNVVNLKKSSYNDYICNIIGDSLSSNPKRFWSHVKMAQTENIEIPTLKENGIHYISNTDKADTFYKVSGLKVNNDKTEAYWLGISRQSTYCSI